MGFETQIYPESPFVLLENSADPKEALLLFEAPHQLITAATPDELETAFDAIEAALEQGNHVAGFMNYELGLALEPKLQHRLKDKSPLLWFGVFKDKTIISKQDLNDWLEHKGALSERASLKHISITPQERFSTYEKKFRAVKDAISKGDIYQLNLTFKVKIEDVKHPLSLYAEMCRNQPVSYASLIMTGSQTILSASPELFIKNTDGWLETRPMKGTLKRAPTRKQDLIDQDTLRLDEKSRAENLMIVDLMRNDLSRISQTGTVTVEDLFKVETYHSLHQMISIIRAKQKPDLPLIDQMRALFPPGSITGAPKIRAMELIDDLEKKPRGIYTGAIGYFGPDKNYCFNVAIRTVTLDKEGNGEMGIGSGLLYDSKAKDEYDECLLKLKFLQNERPEFSLLETMAYTPTEGILYKTEHIDRLAHSASYFQYPFDQQEFETLLDSFIENTSTSLRLRVLLSSNGAVSITPTKLEKSVSDASWRVVWADTPMNSNNLYLYHKTTHRAFYDDARERAQKKDKTIKEVIFINERGEVTEGSFTNVFIEQAGKLVTPPLSSGLLPGTLREHLLKNQDVTEKVLTMQDFETADQIYVGNSVRGLIKAHFN